MNLHLRTTAFDGYHRLASGPLREVALRVKAALDSGVVVGPVASS
jgi:hypothetical protein